jgi:hypothetical protein
MKPAWHRVGSGFLEEQQPNRVSPVVAGDGLPLLETVGNGGDVPQPYHAAHRHRVRPGQRHGADLLDGLEFTDGPERVAVPAHQHGAAGGVLIGVRDGGLNLPNIQVVRLEGSWIHLHMNLPLQPPGRGRLRHAVDLFETPLEHLLG